MTNIFKKEKRCIRILIHHTGINDKSYSKYTNWSDYIILAGFVMGINDGADKLLLRMGNEYSYGYRFMVVTYYPSFLLRNLYNCALKIRF